MCVECLIDQDPPLFAKDIIKDLAKQFDNFSISKLWFDYYLKNNMLMAIKTKKEPIFEEDSVNNLDTRFEWGFMKWRETDLDHTKNRVFIDEVELHIDMRNNWARSARRTSTVATRAKTKMPSHTTIDAIHSSGVIHVVLKKSLPKFETEAGNKMKGQLW